MIIEVDRESIKKSILKLDNTMDFNWVFYRGKRCFRARKYQVVRLSINKYRKGSVRKRRNSSSQ